MAHHTDGSCPPTARKADWASLALGLGLALAVSVPSLLWAESGPLPLIDRADTEWWVPAGLVLVALAAGGAVAARRRRGIAAALHGLAVGVVASGLFLLADVLRRQHLHKPVTRGVAHLWGNGALAACGAALCGALLVTGARRLRPTGREGPGAD